MKKHPVTLNEGGTGVLFRKEMFTKREKGRMIVPLVGKHLVHLGGIRLLGAVLDRGHAHAEELCAEADLNDVVLLHVIRSLGGPPVDNNVRPVTCFIGYRAAFNDTRDLEVFVKAHYF